MLWSGCQESGPDLRKLSVGAGSFAHVFEGGGYGVAVTAAPVVLPPWPVEMPPLGLDGNPVRLSDLRPVAAWRPEQKCLGRGPFACWESQLPGFRVQLVARLAHVRPDADGSCPGTAGAASPVWAPDQEEERLPGVSEFFPDELALI